MLVEGPYLLFLGEVGTRHLAKTACGARDWAPERCLGQLRLSPDALDLGLPDMTVGEAAGKGARTLVIGVASPGGRISESWRAVLIEALEAGLDIAAGLHDRLNADETLKARADALGRKLIDLRDPPSDIPVGHGRPRSGRRVLTVGTDCAVGKKYTALAIWRGLQAAGAKADFCATGQTGVLISGRGFAIDSVVADFLAGAAETLAPAAPPDHWDVIEGQGALFHPAYAGVTVGLVHGAQPEAIVLCHEAGRDELALFPGFPTPDLETAIARYLELARLTSPNVYCAGVSLNTGGLDDAGAEALIASTAEALGLPVIDPMRGGAGPIVARLMGGAS